MSLRPDSELFQRDDKGRFVKGNQLATYQEKWTLTDEQREAVVQALSVGLPLEDARKLVINPKTGKPPAPDTLVRKLGADYEGVVAERKAKLLNAMFQTAMDREHRDHGNMARFLARAHVGMRDDPNSLNIKAGEGAAPVLVIGVTQKNSEEGENVIEHDPD